MSNPIQEQPYDPFQSFSTLCLNSSSSSAVDPSLCSSCFRPHSRSSATPMKRPSPTPPSSQQLSTVTTSKNLLLDPQQPNSIPFSKINLPIPFPPSVSPLRRSLSDPTDARNFSPPLQTQSPAKRLCLNSPLPPLPLRRTVSDPNPAPEKTSDSPIKIQKDSPESKVCLFDVLDFLRLVSYFSSFPFFFFLIFKYYKHKWVIIVLVYFHLMMKFNCFLENRG